MTENTLLTEDRRLSGHLGTVGVVFMVVAAAAPLTVIGGNMPLAMGLGNGAGAPVGFLIAALVLLLFSIGFVTMTPHVPEAGAFFSYVTVGLGKRPGTGIAVVALIAYTAIQVGIYGYIGWAIDDTVRFYGGPEIPWPVYSFGVLAIVALLGYRHIDLSAKVLGVALALEISIVVILDLVIVANPGPSGLALDSFRPEVFTNGSLGIAVLFALTGFIGFEATAVFRDEARDPERTIPRATYAAVLIIGSFYALTCWAFVVAIGPDQVAEVAQRTLDGEANMLLDTTNDTLGRIGRDVVNVLLLTSLFACVLSFHNVIARYQFVLAGKGLLPRRLGTVHATHHSPALLVGGADRDRGGDRVDPRGVRSGPVGRSFRLDGGRGNGRHGVADAEHVARGAGLFRPPPRAGGGANLADRHRARAGMRRPAGQSVAGAVQLHARHRRQRRAEHRPGGGSICGPADRIPGRPAQPNAGTGGPVAISACSPAVSARNHAEITNAAAPTRPASPPSSAGNTRRPCRKSSPA